MIAVAPELGRLVRIRTNCIDLKQVKGRVCHPSVALASRFQLSAHHRLHYAVRQSCFLSFYEYNKNNFNYINNQEHSQTFELWLRLNLAFTYLKKPASNLNETNFVADRWNPKPY
jgi:hypothetical protein